VEPPVRGGNPPLPTVTEGEGEGEGEGEREREREGEGEGLKADKPPALPLFSSRG